MSKSLYSQQARAYAPSSFAFGSVTTKIPHIERKPASFDRKPDVGFLRLGKKKKSAVSRIDRPSLGGYVAYPRNNTTDRDPLGLFDFCVFFVPTEKKKNDVRLPVIRVFFFNGVVEKHFF